MTLYILFCVLTLPDIKSVPNAFRSPKITVLSSEGVEIASYGAQYADPVSLKDLPQYVPQAVIAIEDIRFYSHIGVDFRSVARAVLTNVIKGKKAQGASTLTQQVAKNLFLTNEKTFHRKVKELLLALWLEHKLTKDQILTIYLNRVYLGAGSYGIEAAAHRYYGIPATHLNLYQSATIAALLKAPSHYNPISNPVESNKRARLVLANMVKAGFITARLGLNVAETGAVAGKHKDKSVLYFTDWIAQELDYYLGDLTQDIVVETTLALPLQKNLSTLMTQTLSSSEALNKKVGQGASVVLSYDGAVLAMTGGKDYETSQFNRATEAKRQIGSIFKPFVYLTAFENGAKASDVVEDVPLNIKGFSPKNATGRFYGKITLADALIYSVNTVAVKTAITTGVRKVLKMGRKFGIVTEECSANASIALGVCQTRLIDVVAGYASLANGGFGVTPYGISKITGKDKTVLYKRVSTSERSPLVRQKYIEQLDQILEDVVSKGTGTQAQASMLVKGKTGTTQNYRDAWFVGYTPDIIAGVWLGNDNETPMDQVGGGSLPAQLFSKIINASLFLRPDS